LGYRDRVDLAKLQVPRLTNTRYSAKGSKREMQIYSWVH